MKRMMTMVAVALLIVLGAMVLTGTIDAGPGGVGMLCLGGMAVLPSLKDREVKITRALPGSNTTVYATPGIDTGVTPAGVQPDGVEYLLTAPALTTAQLGDAATMKYSILMDTVDPVDASSVVLFADCITQTGAGGAGAAAATFRFKLPSNATRILGFKITNSANADASAASATLEALF